MKKIFYLSVIILGISLFIPTNVSAFTGWTYDRIPVGTEIISPVSVSITTDDIINFDNDCQSGCSLGNGCEWWVEIWDQGENVEYNSEKISISNLSHTFEIDLPVGSYNMVCAVAGYDALVGYCDIPPEGGCFEEDFEAPVFIITEPPVPTGNILSIGAVPVSALAYVGELFGDIYPYIGLLIGIPLAFWIIGSIIDTAKKKKKGRKFN